MVIHQSGIIAIRDGYGVRPLSLANLGDSIVIASETCAFDIIGAKFNRDIANGEMLIINNNGLESLFPFNKISCPKKFWLMQVRHRNLMA